VDFFGQENDDAVLFAHAAKEGRVFLTCDEGIQAIAHHWLRQGRTDFRMIYCTMEHQQHGVKKGRTRSRDRPTRLN
jgi:hypothetical protein